MTNSISYHSQPVSDFLVDLVPFGDFFASKNGDEQSLFDFIQYRDYSYESTDDAISLLLEVVLPEPLVINLPALDGFSFVIGDSSGASFLQTQIKADLNSFSVVVPYVQLAFQVPPSILKPSAIHGNLKDRAEITSYVSFSVNELFDPKIDAFSSFQLAPCEIGSTGIVVSAEHVAFDLSSTSSIFEIEEAGFNESFKGIYLDGFKVFLPDYLPDVELELSDFVLGTGGISGDIAFNNNKTPVFNKNKKEYQGDTACELFGFSFHLKNIDISFKQNAFVRSSLEGEIYLPYFDVRLEVNLSLDMDGGLTIEVSGVPSGQGEERDGIFVLKKNGLFEISVESLRFEANQNEMMVILAGDFKPDVGGLDWPSFYLERLAISSDGNIVIEGGWLDLPDQYSLDFYGFNFEITKLGFGKTDSGENWIGFNGGIKFVDKMSAGASVEGLKISWNPNANTITPRLSFEGIEVEFSVPDAIEFKGAVAYRELPGGVTRFDGAISVNLPTLGLEVDGILVIGRAPGYTFFAIYLDAALPAGIPIFNTGLALYGMSGLFALNMEPGKLPDEPWYGLAPGEGWYRRKEIGVTDLKNKWVNRNNSIAFGAGITIGTVTDNGYSFSSKLLLAMVLPGPIIMLEGKANILKERSKLDEEPLFRAIIVFDGRAGTLTAGLNASYQFDPENGTLIKIAAGVEAFFSFSDPDKWHIYLGEKDPKEKRIRAEIYSLLEGDSYLMLDPGSLAMGGSLGIDKHYRFGPLSVGLEAWIEGHARLSIKPVHFYGELWLHGGARLAVFGFGIGLTADARVSAEVTDPYHLVGDFRVAINLPWPLDDIGATVKLEWGPEPGKPPIPLPLKEISLSHPKLSTRWQLPREGVGNDTNQQLLKPNYNSDGFYRDPANTDTELFPESAPVVPLDARPEITFGRSVHDEAVVGVNAQILTPERELIGDPEKAEGPLSVKYSLVYVDLQALSNGAWQTVASSNASQSDNKLYGAWASISQPDVNQNNPVFVNSKLTLWSKNGFDYAKNTTGAWAESFSRKNHNYPCIEAPNCFDFRIQQGPIQTSSSMQYVTIHEAQATPQSISVVKWRRRENITAYWTQTQKHPQFLFNVGLSFSQNEGDPERLVVLSVPVSPTAFKLKLRLGKRTLNNGQTVLSQARVRAITTQTREIEEQNVVTSQNIEFFSPNDTYSRFIEIRCDGYFEIKEVCWSTRTEDPFSNQAGKLASNLRVESRRWSQKSNVLAPNTAYRLRVVTSFEALGSGKLDGVSIKPSSRFVQDDNQVIDNVIVEYGYFKTEGAPALALLTVPAQSQKPENIQKIDTAGNKLFSKKLPVLNSLVDDLALYVQKTLPETNLQNSDTPQNIELAYRSYDVAVEFNENYVDLLYRLGSQDLSLNLYDSNNIAAENSQGSPLHLNNIWGESEQLSLNQTESVWVSKLTSLPCVDIEPAQIITNPTLRVQSPFLLQPSTVYECRLEPSLLSEPFNDLSDWSVSNSRNIQSQWQVNNREYISGNRAIIQGNTFNFGEEVDVLKINAALDVVIIYDPITDLPNSYRIFRIENTREVTLQNAPFFPSTNELRWLITGGRWVEQRNPQGRGSLINKVHSSHLALALSDRDTEQQPINWKAYQASTTFFSGNNIHQGIAVHFQPNKPYLRYVMGRKALTAVVCYRQVAVVDGNQISVIEETNTLFSAAEEFNLRIELNDGNVNITENNKPLFSFKSPLKKADQHGTVALLSHASTARFGELKINSLEKNKPIAYAFKFKTSAFANFSHHIHDHDGNCWPIQAQSTPVMANAHAHAVPPGKAHNSVSLDENLAYTSILKEVGMSPNSLANKVDVSRLIVGDALTVGEFGIILRSPEPLDWSRLSLEIKYSNQHWHQTIKPTSLKIINALHNDDYLVSLFARESQLLKGHQLQARYSANVIFWSSNTPPLTKFHTLNNAQASSDTTSWRYQNNSLIVKNRNNTQHESFYYFGFASSMILEAEININKAHKNSTAFSGVFFGKTSPTHYYRFIWEKVSNRYLLEKIEGNTVKEVWSSPGNHNAANAFNLKLIVNQRNIQLIIEGNNTTITTFSRNISGDYGLTTHGAIQATFNNLSILERSFKQTLFETQFADSFDLNEWEIHDEPPYSEAKSNWKIINGVLNQTSNIYGHVGGEYFEPGTQLSLDRIKWSNYRCDVRMRALDNDAIGVIFRQQSKARFYRFSMDSERKYRRLVKHIDGDTTLLWEDNNAYNLNQWYNVTIECYGAYILCFVNGQLLCSVLDEELTHGGIGLYCRANESAQFASVKVKATIDSWFDIHNFEKGSKVLAGDRLDLVTKFQLSDTNSRVKNVVASEVNTTIEKPLNYRLIKSDISVVHQRSVLSLDKFNETKLFKIVRNHDMTGVIILPSNQWDEGSYSFDFTYRKNNTASSSSNAILSENGNQEDEFVRLEFVIHEENQS